LATATNNHTKRKPQQKPDRIRIEFPDKKTLLVEYTIALRTCPSKHRADDYECAFHLTARWARDRLLLDNKAFRFPTTDKEKDMAGNEQMIIDLDKKRMTAMAQKDVAALKTMLCKGLVYTHSSARQDTKQSILEAMESGKTVYTSMVPSEVKAQDLGNAVVLTGVAAISVNSNGKPNSFRVRFTDVYENQNGTWRMITWQSTKIPD
jgi:hypothetical protein